MESEKKNLKKKATAKKSASRRRKISTEPEKFFLPSFGGISFLEPIIPKPTFSEKLKNFWNTRKHEIVKISSAVLILAVLLGIGFPEQKIHGASYTFSQSSWTGGATSNTGVHPTNQLNWNQFSTSTNIAATTSIQLATSSAALSGRTDVTGNINVDAVNPVVATDSNGITHVAYISREYSSSTWNVAYRNSSNWASRVDLTTDTSASSTLLSGLTDQTMAIGVNSSNTVYVAYLSHEFNSAAVNIALRNSSSWVTRTDVTSQIGGTIYSISRVSMAIDTSNTIYIAYHSAEYNVNTQNVAYRTSANWTVRYDVTTNTSGSIQHPSIAVDSTGKIHVAYYSSEYSGSQLQMNVAYRNSSNWTVRTDVTTVITGGGATSPFDFINLKVDSNGTAHIVYPTGENLGGYTTTIAYRNSTNWAARVDVTSVASSHPSMSINSSRQIYVVYNSNESNASFTNMAYRSSSNWGARVDITSNATVNATSTYSAVSFNSSSSAVSIAYFSNEFNGTVSNIAFKTYTPSGYQTSGNLISSAYDTASASNVVNGFNWSEDSTLPSGTTVIVSLRTASTSAGLSSASWVDLTDTSSGCTKTGTSTVCTAAAIPALMKDGVGDEWMQYKVALTGGINTPTITQIQMVYIVNSPPQFNPGYGTNGVIVSQDATSTDATWGKVLISYSVEDPDTNTGSTTPGFITPSFEYSLDGGSTWSAITSQYLAAGDLNNKAVATSTYSVYSATWNAQSQIPGSYSTSTKIRITANDNEPANNTAQAISAAFTLNTKPPVVSVFNLDSSQSTSTLSFTIYSSSTSFQYEISNNSNLSADGLNSTSGQWQNVSTSTYSNSTYYWNATGYPSYEKIYLITRDNYGNTSATSTVVAPATPTSTDIKDTSNVAINVYRQFISWNVYTPTTSAAFANYKIYRSSDGANYSLLSTIADPNINYYTDNNVASTTTYYYKVKVTDTDGDVSHYSNVVSHQPNGRGGTNLTPPQITSVTVSQTQATWATVTWTTDELANSEVGYSVSPSKAYGTTSTNSAYVLSHSVTLTGLTPGTAYLFRVKSTDINSNVGTNDNGGNGYAINTVQGPIISAVAISAVNDKSATITWNTNTLSDSNVLYATNTSALNANQGVTTVSSSTLTTGHTVILTGLTKQTSYYFYVKSTDGNNNSVTDTNGGAYYNFTTTADNTPPVISGITTPVITSDTVVIVWQTDELADDQVVYGTASGVLNQSSLQGSVLSINHAVSISGLNASTKYYYQVKSKDAANNLATSGENNVTTTIEGKIIYIPVGSGGGGSISKNSSASAVISNIKVSNITAFGATISFDTDKDSVGFVLYGKDSSYGYTAGASGWSTHHDVVIPGLRLGTVYHFKIEVNDKDGNTSDSDDRTFTTKFAAESLDNLTKLNNASQFQDQLENLIESVLPSLAPPFLADVKVGDITENSAAVIWKTNTPSYGSVKYAAEKDYDEKKSDPYSSEASVPDAKSLGHSITLANLSPATTYHYQARSYSLPGVIGSSKDQTFTTKESKIKPEIVRVGNTDFEIRWETSVKTSSYVEYKDVATGKEGQVGDAALITLHSLKVDNLTPDARYSVRAYGYTERQVLVEGESLMVRTTRDITPPGISSIRVDNALLPGRNDRLQSVVSWKTDEPATSEVFFEEGVGTTASTTSGTSLTNKVSQNEYTTDHIVILTALKPSTVYRLQIVSADQAGNVTDSPVRTILTPRSAETVLDVIIKNLQDTFGFLNKLR